MHSHGTDVTRRVAVASATRLTNWSLACFHFNHRTTRSVATQCARRRAKPPRTLVDAGPHALPHLTTGWLRDSWQLAMTAAALRYCLALCPADLYCGHQQLTARACGALCKGARAFPYPIERLARTLRTPRSRTFALFSRSSNCALYHRTPRADKSRRESAHQRPHCSNGNTARSLLSAAVPGLRHASRGMQSGACIQ